MKQMYMIECTYISKQTKSDC